MAESLNHGTIGAVDPVLPDDRAILRKPDTQRLRLQVALYAPMIQVHRLKGRVPSYVYDAAHALIAAMTRWEKDEESCLRD